MKLRVRASLSRVPGRTALGHCNLVASLSTGRSDSTQTPTAAALASDDLTIPPAPTGLSRRDFRGVDAALLAHPPHNASGRRALPLMSSGISTGHGDGSCHPHSGYLCVTTFRGASGTSRAGVMHLPVTFPETLGALRASPWGAADRATRSVKDELRQNLLVRLADGGPLFPGVLGYDDTVMPQLVNALLARHNFILLGLRGQAKSRILRALATMLDPAMPVVAGSEVNDNPFAPISKFARQLLDEAGDDTPISWVERSQRYVEKLATPDVTIADLIGDLDPIRAARGGHLLSDELTIHYGMLPRANRGIFALNELPDLAGKVQVGQIGRAHV